MLRPVLLTLVSALLFGAAAPASKWLLRGLDPVALAGWLYLGAALGVAPAFLRGRPTSPRSMDARSRRRLAGAIVFGGVIGPVALLFGLRLATASSVSLWLNLELVATALLGHLFFREQLDARGWIGTLGVIGASMALTVGQGRAGLAAVALVAVACLCWGLDNHLTALIDGIAPAETTFWKGLGAGAFNLALAWVLGAGAPAPLEAAAALGVGALTYGVSIALYITAAQQLGATRAQMLFASAPFLGAVLSALALRETIGPVQVGAALVLVTSLVVLFRRHTHEHHHGALEHEHWHRHDDGHHLHRHEGLPASHGHSHRHRHEPLTHAHPHWHDLHHRHPHAADDAGPSRS
jgi:drug/metabolite transporter (DMT)-like permease